MFGMHARAVDDAGAGRKSAKKVAVAKQKPKSANDAPSGEARPRKPSCAAESRGDGGGLLDERLYGFGVDYAAGSIDGYALAGRFNNLIEIVGKLLEETED